MTSRKRGCQKRLNERKTHNSISTTTFKSTREKTNGAWNMKSCGKNKLEEVLTTWERSRLLEAFPILYDSKSSTLLGLVASL